MKEQKENWEEEFKQYFCADYALYISDAWCAGEIIEFIRKEIQQAREEEREKMEWEYKNQTERDEAYN